MPNRKFKVLQIDDDFALARLVERALTRRGYLYVHAQDARTGMELIAAGGIDVVVLDHFLDDSIGVKTLHDLKLLENPPPVVYVTGSQEPNVAVEALKAGAADYVIKTIGDEFILLLVSAIEQSIEHARLQRQKEAAEREVREARDRAEVLLAEVNHRVGNSLAMVAALVRMQAATLHDQKSRDALSETEARILAIASLHRRLYTSDDVRHVALDSYIQSLIDELDTTMRAAGHSLTVNSEMEPAYVPTDKAVSVGMIVIELLTNAYKYAYAGLPPGEARVFLSKIDDERLQLRVEDDGVGWNGNGKPKGTGLGGRLVTAMANQLGTEMEYGTGENGTRISMTIPV